MEVIKVQAHAKINLTLKVLGKRDDGYHQVEMVLQSLKLHDELLFSYQDHGIELSVDGAVPAGQDNLVYRAALLLKQHTGTTKGVSINLTKRIPVAAGLAGGSADAAASLMALNKLWNLRLNINELSTLGEKLGSDIPFCLMGGTALAGGRGEQLTKLAPAPEMGIILVKSFFGVSTAEIYGGYGAVGGMLKGSNEATNLMINALENKDIYGIAKHLTNDLERVTFRKYPELIKIKERLKQSGALGVLMSGSGPTIYGITDNLASAYKVADTIRDLDAQIIVTSTIN